MGILPMFAGGDTRATLRALQKPPAGLLPQIHRHENPQDVAELVRYILEQLLRIRQTDDPDAVAKPTRARLPSDDQALHSQLSALTSQLTFPSLRRSLNHTRHSVLWTFTLRRICSATSGHPATSPLSL